MEQPIHDPRTKQQIKDTLFSFLYGPVQGQFKKRLDAIILSNSQALSSPHLSFFYKGEVYCKEGEKLPRRMNKLIPQLHSAMNDYLKDLEEINEKEIPYVLGFINQVLNASNDLHDYLRVLPPIVHSPIQHLIDSCPCRTKRLTDTDVQDLLLRNTNSIELMKRRMVTNLIIV